MAAKRKRSKTEAGASNRTDLLQPPLQTVQPALSPAARSLGDDGGYFQPRRPDWHRSTTATSSVSRVDFAEQPHALRLPRPNVFRQATQSDNRRGSRPRASTVGEYGAVAPLVDEDHARPRAYVNPIYAELNPEYEQPVNSRPVWGLAGPLPRVVRPRMLRNQPQIDAEESVGRAYNPTRLPSATLAQRRASLIRSRFQRARLGSVASGRSDYPATLRSSQRRASAASHQPSVKSHAKQSALSVGPLSPGTRTQDGRSGSVATESHAAVHSHVHVHHHKRIGLLDKFPAVYDPAKKGFGPTLEEEEECLDENKADLREILDLPPPWAEVDPLAEVVEEVVENLPVEPEIYNNHTLWSVFRTRHREFLAEFLAVLVQVTIGLSANIQGTVKHKEIGNITTSWTWGFASIAAIHIAGGVSGAHLNPAVTIMLWVFRGFPKRMIPKYIFAQVLGAFLATFLAIHAYLHIDKGPIEDIINSFVTNRRMDYVSGWTGFLNEFVGTALLSCIILALGDDHNVPPGVGMAPLVIGFVGVSLAFAMSFQTGLALNPSRDFGSRLAIFALGYGKKLFTDPYWFYGPILGPLSGIIVGAGLYDIFIFTGGESPINFPWSRRKAGYQKRRTKWLRRTHLQKHVRSDHHSGDEIQ